MPATEHTGEMDSLSVRLLGGFQVTAGTRAIDAAAWRLRKAHQLVARLALAPGRRQQREQLLDLLWPDLDLKAAGNNLRYTLHVVRRLLAPASTSAGARYLRSQGGELALYPDGAYWCDVDAFEAAAAAALRSTEPAAYRTAIALYTGDLLPASCYEEWTTSRREALRGRYLSLLSKLAELQESRGELEAAITTLGQLVAAEPTHEEAHAGLMRLYARTGRRHQAVRQYQQLQIVLQRELDAEPGPAGRAIYEAIRAGRPTSAPSTVTRPAPTATGDHPARLPASITRFIGRTSELGALQRSLDNSRLVTLVGTGGCGKSRLALEAATRRAEREPDSVCWTELATITEPALLPSAILAVLGVRERAGEPLLDTLIDALRPRPLLLVLDTCEHLAAACSPLVGVLVRACPELRILATSRMALGLIGEVISHVPPLASADAIQLFVDRAADVRADFVLTDRNAAAVTAVCRQLDGLPLALELAAAWIRVLAVEQIAARLDDGFRLLTGDEGTDSRNRQTLRATLDWSHELLAEPERVLFRRLAVFAGGFDLEAVEAVCGGSTPSIAPLDVLGLLTRLVDQSLVEVHEHAEQPRYRLLGTVRQYAEDHLRRAADGALTHDRHRAWFRGLAERLELATWGGAGQKPALDRLETERDNLRAAIAWSLTQGDTVSALRLTGALGRFWEVRGHLSEGRQHAEAALERSNGAPALVRARALNAAGRIARVEGDSRRAAALLEESLLIFRELGNPLGVATVLLALGSLALQRGDYEPAAARYEEALALYRELQHPLGAASALVDLGTTVSCLGDDVRASSLIEESVALFRACEDRRGVAWALLELGVIALHAADRVRAVSHFDASLALCRDLADRPGVAHALHHLGIVAQSEGDLARAAMFHRASLTVYRETGDRPAIAACLERLAVVAAATGRAKRSLRLAGAASALREATGTPPAPFPLAALEEALAAARRQAGPAVVQAVWTEGRWMSLPAAVAYALTPEDGTPGSAASRRDGPAPTSVLSGRGAAS